MTIIEGDRVIRVTVDTCFVCPFRRHARNQSRCHHPGLPPQVLKGSQLHEPPEWCPLRNSVTMIAGPGFKR